MEKKSKKIYIPEEIAYVIGMIAITLGVFFCVRANFGVSMIVAPAYIVSQKLGIPFGYGEYILQGILLIVFVIIIRKIKIGYLFTIVTVLIYGAILNMWTGLLSGYVDAEKMGNGFIRLFGLEATKYTINATTMTFRIVFLILGILLSAVGIANFFKSYISPQSYELLVMGISRKFNFNQNKVKIIYDFSSLGAAVILSFILFGGLTNNGTWLIGIGTVVICATNGIMIALYGKFLDKHFEFKPAFPKLKKYFEF